VRYRKLRIAWSVAWGIALLLFIPLWARSYWFDSAFEAQRQRTFVIVALAGGVARIHGQADFSNLPTRMRWGFSNDPHKSSQPFWVPELILDPNPEFGYGLITPCWLVAVFLSLLGVAPWLCFRYSLRTLLIATTLVALLLGLFAWLR